MDTSIDCKRPAECIDCYRPADIARDQQRPLRDPVRLMDTTNDCKRTAEAAINKHGLQQILLEASIDGQRSSEINGYYDTTISCKRPGETSRDLH